MAGRCNAWKLTSCCILLMLADLFVEHEFTHSTPVREESPSSKSLISIWNGSLLSRLGNLFSVHHQSIPDERASAGHTHHLVAVFDQPKPEDVQNPLFFKSSKKPSGKKFVFENNVFEMGTHNLSCSVKLQIKRPPSGLIIGEKKCGTSAMMVFLSLHPHIALPTSEKFYFNNPKSFVKDTTKKYVKLMPVTCPDDVTMEKSLRYFRDPAVAYRVYNFYKSMRMILLVRDPVQRLVSDYAMTVRTRQKKTPSLENLVLTEKNGSLSVNGESSLVRLSMYSEHLENWLSVFPRDQLLILDGDKFIVENPARSLRDVATLMGVDSYYEDNMFYYDSKKGYYCLSKEGCLPDAKGHSFNSSSYKNETITLLRDFFAPYNQQFYNLSEVKFDWDKPY